VKIKRFVILKCLE